MIGGALVYTIFLSTASSSSGGISVQISGVTLSASNGLTMNIKNSGSNSITNSSTLAISGSVLTATPILTASPATPAILSGKTQTVVIPALDLGSISPGTSYTLTLVAQDTAGSTSSFTYTVTATS